MHNSIFTLVDREGLIIFDQKEVQIREFDLENKIFTFSVFTKKPEDTEELTYWLMGVMLGRYSRFVITDGILRTSNECWKFLDVFPKTFDFEDLDHHVSENFHQILVVTFSEYEKL